MKNIYQNILQTKQRRQKIFSVLIDPDKLKLSNFSKIVKNGENAGVDLFLIGGSLLMHNSLEYCLTILKNESSIPAILFPGNVYQLSDSADAILFLSLISGRNPDFLIGNQVISAPFIKNSSLEVISTGYMLINGGKPTAAAYMSNTNPIPSDQVDIAKCTAIAAELLGFKTIYMDAGSGAAQSVRPSMIREVREAIDIPIIVGGGIKTTENAMQVAESGADMVVVGNAIEKDPVLIKEFSDCIHSINSNS